MSLSELLLFIPACFALNLSFGPNNLTSVTTGAQYGWSAAMVSAIGRLLAFIPMIAISAAGLGLLLATSATAFAIVKYAGAAYLIWLGIRILRSDPSQVMGQSGDRARGGASLVELGRREFLIAAGNPKAIVIFTAFLPQFVDPQNYWVSFLICGVLFLLLEWCAIALYAGVGKALATSTNVGVVRWFVRGSGVTMIAFGALLAFARREPA